MNNFEVYASSFYNSSFLNVLLNELCLTEGLQIILPLNSRSPLRLLEFLICIRQVIMWCFTRPLGLFASASSPSIEVFCLNRDLGCARLFLLFGCK